MSSIKEYFKQEGRIEGIQEGRKEGKEEGKMEGRKEGLEEGFKRVAFNMLKNGESAEKIALFTGLSTE
jgi:predicted transposase YdaD